MDGPLFGPDDIVADLRRSLRSHNTALQQAPRLLRLVLETDAWRDFHTPLGDHVTHDRFATFVEAEPDEGLGSDVKFVETLIHDAGDPDLLRKLKAAEGVGRGSAGRGRPSLARVDSTRANDGADRVINKVERLARDYPEQYAAVKSGELSVNAAAVLAGISPRRISVRLDNPVSIARSLWNHLEPDQIAQLVKALTELSEEN